VSACESSSQRAKFDTLNVEIDRVNEVDLRVDELYAATVSHSVLARLTPSRPPKEFPAFAFDFFVVSESLGSSVATAF
jgi:hypothetical protein